EMVVVRHTLDLFRFLVPDDPAVQFLPDLPWCRDGLHRLPLVFLPVIPVQYLQAFPAEVQGLSVPGVDLQAPFLAPSAEQAPPLPGWASSFLFFLFHKT